MTGKSAALTIAVIHGTSTCRRAGRGSWHRAQVPQSPVDLDLGVLVARTRITLKAPQAETVGADPRQLGVRLFSLKRVS